jgi:asparagine synthase (glutamine-hydrolysing)
MAGIAGVKGKDNGELSRMLEVIKHRGPNETWINQGQGVNLGCCELNVEGDSRPGSHYAANGDRAVVLDGRLYEKGSHTDAEAVLALYNKFGPRFAENIDGDFACAISDGGQVILARDWAGIKPLYYGHCDGRLCFASEAKSLVGIADDVKEFPPGYVYSLETGFLNYSRQKVETPDFEDFC